MLEAAGYTVDTAEASGVSYDAVLRDVPEAVDRVGLLAVVAALVSPAAALDLEVVERLRVLGREVQADRFFAELVVQFVGDTDVRLAGMRAAVHGVHFGTIERLAHALKGAAAHLGGVRLVAACITLEDAAEAGVADAIASALAIVEREYAILRQALDDEVERCL